MSSDNVGKGNGEGSMPTRIKKGEIRNPKGRPKGAKNRETVAAEIRDSLMQVSETLVTLPSGREVIQRETLLRKLIRACVYHVGKGDPRFLDFFKFMILNMMALQAREATKADQDNLADLLRVYQLHENGIFNLSEAEIGKMVEIAKKLNLRERQSYDGLMEEISQIMNKKR